MSMRQVAVLLALVAVAVPLGFAAGLVVLLGLSAALPPFRREDGDTLREFVPVALGYVAWAATTALALVAGWRRVRRGR
jgi:hypothetical protein